MSFLTIKKAAALAGAAVAAVLLWRFGLPVALPFLLGALVALAAEPLVGFLGRKLPRSLSSAVGVSVALLALLSLLVLLTALLLRQLTGLSDAVPQVISTVRAGLGDLQGMLTELSDKAPKGVRPLLQRTVDGVFTDGGAVLDSALERLPAAASAVLSYITDSFLAVGTGCLAAYMISARLPQLRSRLRDLPPENPVGKILPRLKGIRHALWGWLKAQAKLCVICFGILLVGFWILGIGNPPLWAAVIALVDAVPLLGTGTVLIPWALVCFLQGQQIRALGLLGIYAAAALTRSALEPRLVGKHLGLDPLVTLISLYAGYQFWGFGGMLVSPLLCVVIKEAAAIETGG